MNIILELWDEELNVKKIVAVIDTSSENSGLYRIRILDLCEYQCSGLTN